jgi:multiple sugar transport system ATP-binding protein
LDAYHYPANRFVAGFLGMPPMNFFDGTVKSLEGGISFVEGKRVAGELTFPPGGFILPVPLPQARRMQAWVDRHVVLGIRPEHIHLRPGAAGAIAGMVDGGAVAAKIGMTINVIEPLGGDMDVYLATALHESVVARMKADAALSAGARTTVFVESSRARFFEPGEAGMNLSLEKASVTGELTHALH